jgi:hypothetical protein
LQPCRSSSGVGNGRYGLSFRQRHTIQRRHSIKQPNRSIT